MKDQVQLNEIAGYLPYELQFVVTQKGRLIEVIKMSGITVDAGELTIWAKGSEAGYGVAFEKKPILRPLSDLTKEITHNGKKIILAKALWSVSAEDEEDFDMYGHIPEYWSLCIHHIENNLSRVEYGDVLALHEYHLDLHNLIERGLAININDLPPIKD